VGNVPVPDALVWSIISVVLLILGIAAALFFYLRYIRSGEYDESNLVIDFPEPQPTPSQKVTLAYFLVAVLLFVIQIGFGAITGHHTVEGPVFSVFPSAISCLMR
jgi:nitric oxide reductase subunit B